MLIRRNYIFVAFLLQKAFCAFCNDRIWGLGRQGFKCINCKLMVHKKCHKLFRDTCTGTADSSTVHSSESSPSSIGVRHTNNMNGTDITIIPKDDMKLNSRISTPNAKRRHPNLYDNNFNKDATANVPQGQDVDVAGGDEQAMASQYSLKDFELLRVIGRGSYAKVLMVELKRTKRIYAMKVIKKELVTDDEDIDWVQTEKHVFETASNYPFLVGLHSCFQTKSRLFFVIEFVRGGDLMFHMQTQRRLPEEHARFYSAEICLALSFLHERGWNLKILFSILNNFIFYTLGIIYRDLKLDNVRVFNMKKLFWNYFGIFLGFVGS